MRLYYYKSTTTPQFDGPYDVGRQNAYDITTPDGVSRRVVGEPNPGEGIYEAISPPENPAPDNYQAVDTPNPLLSFEGTEGDAAARVRESTNWIDEDLADTAARKFAEGEQYADRVAFSSAQTEQNSNVYVITRSLNVMFYNVAQAWYADRHKRRTIGKDSSQGYTAPADPQNPTPSEDPSPLTYWARDVSVRLINATNGNRIKRKATEEEWAQVLKEVGTHFQDTLDALDNYEDAVQAAFDASDRATLIALDPSDPSYGWPPFYDGPGLGLRLARGYELP